MGSAQDLARADAEIKAGLALRKCGIPGARVGRRLAGDPAVSDGQLGVHKGMISNQHQKWLWVNIRHQFCRENKEQ